MTFAKCQIVTLTVQNKHTRDDITVFEDVNEVTLFKILLFSDSKQFFLEISNFYTILPNLSQFANNTRFIAQMITFSFISQLQRHRVRKQNRRMTSKMGQSVHTESNSFTRIYKMNSVAIYRSNRGATHIDRITPSIG